MDEQRILQRYQNDKTIYLRSYTKPDGRCVRLYGHVPHNLPPVEEMLHSEKQQSHLRWHPLRQEWSVYASARQNRTFKPEKVKDPLGPTISGGSATEIPFADFELAIFENRFPSFSNNNQDANVDIKGIRTMTATGRCEVVVYTPEATGSLATISQSRRELLVHAWIDQYERLYNEGAAFVLPFENRGEAVGVTLDHPHGQIYAFPVLPAVQSKAADSFASGYNLAKEIGDWQPDYGIVKNNGINAFAPPFSRFPYEIWLAPLEKRAGPWDMTDAEVTGFAYLLGDVTRRYDSFFGTNCPYMLSLHAAPAGEHGNWHFTAQFYPLLRARDRIKYLASVEQSTGMFTVDISPEQTAELLRNI